MRYCGILALPCAVLRYSYPPYAPLSKCGDKVRLVPRGIYRVWYTRVNSYIITKLQKAAINIKYSTVLVHGS